jgi:hypothetical protein
MTNKNVWQQLFLPIDFAVQRATLIGVVVSSLLTGE